MLSFLDISVQLAFHICFFLSSLIGNLLYKYCMCEKGFNKIKYDIIKSQAYTN